MAPRHVAAGIALVVACGGACRDREDVQHARAPAPAPRLNAKPVLAPPPIATALHAFEERVEERADMVREIARDGVTDERVLAAMRKVPRHAFVLPGYRDLAYANRPLPIVGGQTISQPAVVGMMTQAVRPGADGKCLEIGTGSGYQAAILAEVCKATYSIEYLADVARFAEENLRRTGYGPGRVQLRVGDGYVGWPEAAPFNVIVVTAAPDHVPRPLLDQLAVDGRLVIPVGGAWAVQQLELWTRLRPGPPPEAFKREELATVAFVPFLGDAQAR